MSFLTFLIDSLLPPRASERVVRMLTIDELYTLASQTTHTLPYHDPRITALVWEIKYRANKHALALAGQYLADQVLGIASEELGKTVLVPIPMYPSRKKKRGHNQTELLCDALLAHTDNEVEYSPRALKRVRETVPQQGLERQKRLHNVKNSMEAASHVSGKVCIVVDDVTTTGATLEEARRALVHTGARRVHFLTLAQS